jgi:nucleotide-binding universal stress UspA family protein
MFDKVLVPIDLRSIPRMALRVAASLAYSGSQLTLLYVTDVARDFPYAGLTVISEGDIKRHEAAIEQKLGDVQALLSEYGASAATYVVQSRPVHAAINEVAKELRVDAILMGTRGRRGLLRMLHGSVTESVMREADVPVIAIRELSKHILLTAMPGTAKARFE